MPMPPPNTTERGNDGDVKNPIKTNKKPLTVKIKPTISGRHLEQDQSMQHSLPEPMTSIDAMLSIGAMGQLLLTQFLLA